MTNFPSLASPSADLGSVQDHVQSCLPKHIIEARTLKEGIPKDKEELAIKLWEVLRECTKGDKSQMTTPPFFFMELANEMPLNIKKKENSKAPTNVSSSFIQNSFPSHPTDGLRIQPQSYVIISTSLRKPH